MALGLNHLSISPTYRNKFKNPKVLSALLRSKRLIPLLVAFILVILCRWALVTVFENFLEKKKIFQQKNYTTFFDSLFGISERNMSIGIFSIMCRDSSILRGLQKNSLLIVSVPFEIQ